MTNNLTDWDQDLSSNPEEDYRALVRALQWAEGFSLFFLECPSDEKETLIGRLVGDVPEKNIKHLQLTEKVYDLYSIIDNLPYIKETNILFISGIEESLIDSIEPGYGGIGGYYNLDNVPPILSHLNLQRERFRDHFKTCFIFILSSFALKYFIHRAPDFFDWGSVILDFQSKDKIISLKIKKTKLSGDYENILALTPQQRTEKIHDIQELLKEKTLTSTDRIDLIHKRGVYFHANQNYESAIKSYDEVLKIEPNAYIAWASRGAALGNLGRLEDAISNYDKALNLKPDEYRTWSNRGAALVNLGRTEEGILDYNQALEIKPDFYEALYNRGLALKILGQTQQALENFNRVLEINPDSHEALYKSGLLLKSLNRRKEANRKFYKLVNIKPNFYEAWYEIALFSRDAGRREEEIASYNKVIEINPDYHQAWYNRGIALLDIGDIKQSIKSFQNSLRIQQRVGDRSGELRSLKYLSIAFKRCGMLQASNSSRIKQEEISRELREIPSIEVVEKLPIIKMLKAFKIIIKKIRNVPNFLHLIVVHFKSILLKYYREFIDVWYNKK